MVIALGIIWLLDGLEALGKSLTDLGSPVRTADGVRAAQDALNAPAVG